MTDAKKNNYIISHNGSFYAIRLKHKNCKNNTANFRIIYYDKFFCYQTDTSDMFSDRDNEVGYDESESVTISLADNSSSCESDAVSITENTITIKDEGTYILSGSLSDGMVIVEAEDTDKVQIVLNGVSISNDQSAAFYVRSADKVFVTTASGTENTIDHNGRYKTSIKKNNIKATIFSKT